MARESADRSGAGTRVTGGGKRPEGQNSLARLDQLLAFEPRRFREHGYDPADAFRGLYGDQAEVEAAIREMGGHGESTELSGRERHRRDDGLRDDGRVQIVRTAHTLMGGRHGQWS